MLKITLIILGLILISGCSQAETPLDQANFTKECAKIISSFNEKLLSTEKSENIKGWQYMIDFPSCFTSVALDIAKNEVKVLNN